MEEPSWATLPKFGGPRGCVKDAILYLRVESLGKRLRGIYSIFSIKGDCFFSGVKLPVATSVRGPVSGQGCRRLLKTQLVPALGWWVHRGPLKGLRGRRGPGLKPGPQGQRPDRCRLGAAAVEEGDTRTPPQSKAGADAVGGARWAWAGPAGFPRVLSVILEALIRLTRSTETVANGV